MNEDIKALTYDMSDKSDDELWAIVADACRKDTPTWRAYEQLHSNYNQLKTPKAQHRIYDLWANMTKGKRMFPDAD